MKSRKIELNDNYCPVAHTRGGDKNCDHDYEPEPIIIDDYGSTWKCTRCGMETSFDFWD